jgi:hypothetical protein
VPVAGYWDLLITIKELVYAVLRGHPSLSHVRWEKEKLIGDHSEQGDELFP